MNDRILTLGARLHAIASMIKKGYKLGDIGTDHAYLPAYLVQQRIIERAVGVEVNEGPYQSALETVLSYGLDKQIEVRKGSGLNPLQPDEVDVLVIAGMGGNTILEILSEKPDIQEGIQELVLQPQGAESKVRIELLDKGWKIKAEKLVEEDGRIYSVIHFTRTEGLTKTDIEEQIRNIGSDVSESGQKNHKVRVEDDAFMNMIEKYVWNFGPLILQEKNELLLEVLQDNIFKLAKIIQEIQAGGSSKVQEKARRYDREKKVLEAMKKWLYPLDR